VVESSTDWTVNIGAFALVAPNVTATGAYGTGSRGNITYNPNQGILSSGFAAPHSAVLTSTHDIAGDSMVLRVNGGNQVSSTANKGTGNFLAYPLYIGRHGGTTLPLSGLIFSLIVRFGANLDTTAITNTETWVAGKTGVTL